MPEMPRIYTTVSGAMLGIEAEALKPQLAGFFGVKEGVLVRSVVKDSAAEKAGLRAGDVIVKVDQTAVSNPRGGDGRPARGACQEDDSRGSRPR